MNDATRDIEALIALMSRLPGLGPRSARRAVLHLLKKRGQVMAPLAQAMAEVAATARECVAAAVRSPVQYATSARRADSHWRTSFSMSGDSDSY